MAAATASGVVRVHMETGLSLAFSGEAFASRPYTSKSEQRTGLTKKEWTAVLQELNSAVRKELPIWKTIVSFFAVLFSTVVIIVMSTLLSLMGGSNPHRSFLRMVLGVAIFLATGGLGELLWENSQIPRVVANTRQVLAEINDRLRSDGLGCDLLEHRDYMKRYSQTNRRRNGYVLVVRKLQSSLCGVGANGKLTMTAAEMSRTQSLFARGIAQRHRRERAVNSVV